MKRFLYVLFVLLLCCLNFKLSVKAEEAVEAWPKVIALDSKGQIMKDGYGILVYDTFKDEYWFFYQKYGNELVRNYKGELSLGYETKLKYNFPDEMVAEFNYESGSNTILDIVAIKDGCWVKAEKVLTEEIIVFECITETDLRMIMRTEGKPVGEYTLVSVYGNFNTMIDEIKYATFNITGLKYKRKILTPGQWKPDKEYDFKVKVIKDVPLDWNHAPNALKVGNFPVGKNFTAIDFWNYVYSEDFITIQKNPNYEKSGYSKDYEWKFNIAIVDNKYVPDQVCLVDVMFFHENVLIYSDNITTIYNGNYEKKEVISFESGCLGLNGIFDNIFLIIYILIAIIALIILLPLFRLIINFINNISSNRKRE